MVYTAKIYKIVNIVNDDFYIGSTKNELRVRWNQHKKDSRKYSERNGLYQMMNAHELNNFRIILFRIIQCQNREDQLRQEQSCIDELKPKLNKYNALGQQCEHQIKRALCKQCGGSLICEHQKERSHCKYCRGTSICQHQIQRCFCKLCGGTQICEHKIQKRFCKQCNGLMICQHQKRKDQCKQCGGSRICLHQRIRSQCKDCGGSQSKKIYCGDCNTEVRKDCVNNHLKSQMHLRNTLPIFIEY